MKNVIAIASGVIIGSNLGHNAGAAIITRGLSEIIDLGVKMGAKKQLFMVYLELVILHLHAHHSNREIQSWVIY